MFIITSKKIYAYFLYARKMIKLKRCTFLWIRSGGAKGDESEHEEVELLLEAYAADLNHISSEASRMKMALDDTDDFVNTHLSTMRNKIIRMSLFMEMGMFSIALPALLAGILSSYPHILSRLFRKVTEWRSLHIIIKLKL